MNARFFANLPNDLADTFADGARQGFATIFYHLYDVITVVKSDMATLRTDHNLLLPIRDTYRVAGSQIGRGGLSEIRQSDA